MTYIKKANGFFGMTAININRYTQKQKTAMKLLYGKKVLTKL